MQRGPIFLTGQERIAGEVTFKPAKSDRTGELVAWGGVIALGLGVGFLYSQLGKLTCLAVFFLSFFIAAGVLISFGNWLESNTVIRSASRGVKYCSPIRRVDLAWEEVDGLWTAQTGRGWRVRVQGGKKHFSFRTASEIGPGAGRTMRVGVEGGERLANLIYSMAKLSEPERKGDVWLCRKLDAPGA